MMKHASRSRIQTIGLLVIAAIGLLVAGIAGLYIYVSVTTKPLHPNPQDVPSVTHSKPSPQWADAVEQGRQIARAGLLEQNLPGLSIAVGVDGDIVWAEGLGWADYENQTPVTPDTPFRIGTASKTLTSVAVGLLLEQGRLKLDDEIQTYVPEFPKKQWPVTVRQLMGHLAGIVRDGGDEEPVRVRCDRTTGALPRFADSRLRFEPGTQFRYSNYGWILVSAAIEAAAGERYFTFMRRQIFEPLGMEHTAADSGTAALPNRAVYYFPRFGANPYYGGQGPEVVDFSCFAGASAFLSTPLDLVRFVMAVASGNLLRAETVQLLQTSQRAASGVETGYGLGWDLETVELAGTPTRVVGYDGDLRDGIVMSLMALPSGMVVAVMSNISFADTVSIARRIAEVFTEQVKSPARK
jgi:serine beta-lactamase-like protein LACTB, mitochondrial